MKTLFQNFAMALLFVLCCGYSCATTTFANQSCNLAGYLPGTDGGCIEVPVPEGYVVFNEAGLCDNCDRYFIKTDRTGQPINPHGLAHHGYPRFYHSDFGDILNVGYTFHVMDGWVEEQKLPNGRYSVSCAADLPTTPNPCDYSKKTGYLHSTTAFFEVTDTSKSLSLDYDMAFPENALGHCVQELQWNPESSCLLWVPVNFSVKITNLTTGEVIFDLIFTQAIYLLPPLP